MREKPAIIKIIPTSSLIIENFVELVTEATVFKGWAICAFPNGIKPKSVLGVSPVTLLLVRT